MSLWIQDFQMTKKIQKRIKIKIQKFDTEQLTSDWSSISIFALSYLSGFGPINLDKLTLDLSLPFLIDAPSSKNVGQKLQVSALKFYEPRAM